MTVKTGRSSVCDKKNSDVKNVAGQNVQGSNSKRPDSNGRKPSRRHEKYT